MWWTILSTVGAVGWRRKQGSRCHWKWQFLEHRYTGVGRLAELAKFSYRCSPWPQRLPTYLDVLTEVSDASLPLTVVSSSLMHRQLVFFTSVMSVLIL